MSETSEDDHPPSQSMHAERASSVHEARVEHHQPPLADHFILFALEEGSTSTTSGSGPAVPAVPPVPAPVWSACERGMDAGGCRGPAVAGCGQLGARCAHHGAWRIQIRLYLYAWQILLHASPELPYLRIQGDIQREIRIAKPLFSHTRTQVIRGRTPVTLDECDAALAAQGVQTRGDAALATRNQS